MFLVFHHCLYSAMQCFCKKLFCCPKWSGGDPWHNIKVELLPNHISGQLARFRHIKWYIDEEREENRGKERGSRWREGEERPGRLMEVHWRQWRTTDASGALPFSVERKIERDSEEIKRGRGGRGIGGWVGREANGGYRGAMEALRGWDPPPRLSLGQNKGDRSCFSAMKSASLLLFSLNKVANFTVDPFKKKMWSK